MTAKNDQADDEQQSPPQRTRRVPVRTVSAPGVRMMDLPEDVAGQWDDDQWHYSPPGV